MDEVIDRLYRLPPEEFIAARDTAVRELRGAGQKDDANAVKALRRPTVAAWALNQAAAADPDAVTALTSVADELRSAQEEALSGGDAEALRAAGRRKREAVQRLADAASGVLDSGGRDARPQTQAINATLEAAVTNPAVAALLKRGRLVAEPEPNEDDLFGWGAAADTEMIDLTAAAPRVRRPKESRITGPPIVKTVGPASDRAAKRKVLGTAQWERAQAEKAVTRANAAIETAREKKVAAERDLESARRRLAAAEEVAAKVGGKLAEAEQVSADARQRLDDAEAAVEKARQHLEADGDTDTE